MKRCLAAFLFLSSFAFSQTYDISAHGGTLSGPNANSSVLTVTSPVVAVFNPNIEIEGGTISFTTGNRTGSLQLGSAFAAGGNITITTDNEGQIISGAFVAQGSQWQPVLNANGSHFYTLTLSFQQVDGSGNVTASGTFVLLTKTNIVCPGGESSIACFFSGSEAVNMISAHVVIGSGAARRR